MGNKVYQLISIILPKLGMSIHVFKISLSMIKWEIKLVSQLISVIDF